MFLRMDFAWLTSHCLDAFMLLTAAALSEVLRAGGECQEQAGSGACYPEAICGAEPGPFCEAAGSRLGGRLSGHSGSGLPSGIEAHC